MTGMGFRPFSHAANIVNTVKGMSLMIFELFLAKKNW